MVEMIVGSLVREPSPDVVRDRLSDDGWVIVERIPGPVGPIHEVTTNGLHRTHAFALLSLPLIAVEVRVTALPMYVTLQRATSDADDLATRQLSKGLMSRGLLEGVIETRRTAEGGPVLRPDWVAAPWMLCPPNAAAKIAASYDRVYPEALADIGVPRNVMGNPSAWVSWLTRK